MRKEKFFMNTLSFPAIPETVVALDFETSDMRADSACALGMVRIEGGTVPNTLCELIRPPRPRVMFTEIHGITWEMVKNRPTFAELCPDFAAFLRGADYLVAHNAGFDRRILRGCCFAAGIEAPAQPFLCTLVGSRRGFRLRHNRLNDVCEYLGIPLEHHKADSDALACAGIYLHLRRAGLTPEQMRLR